MALTSKYQFWYYTSYDPNTGEALQEPTAALKVMCLTQIIGTLTEFYRLLNAKLDKDSDQYKSSRFSFVT